MDDKTFKDCVFIQGFVEVGLNGVICKVPKERFPTLVLMFYANLNYVDRVLISEMKKHQIQLTLEDFSNIFNLSCTCSNYDDSEEGNNFNTIKTYISFLGCPNSIIPSPFTIGIIRLDIRLIPYLVNHVLLPRKRNSTLINKTNIAPTLI